MKDRILVRNLQVFARHGVLPEEAVLGQRFELDITVSLDLEPAARTDDLARSVSYAEIVRLASAAMTERPFNLIEAAAGAVADAILGAFPTVEEVAIELRKPGAPIEAIFGHVGVAMTRGRSGRGGA